MLIPTNIMFNITLNTTEGDIRVRLYREALDNFTTN